MASYGPRIDQSQHAKSASHIIIAYYFTGILWMILQVEKNFPVFTFLNQETSCFKTLN